jgi:hypothetical protein
MNKRFAAAFAAVASGGLVLAGAAAAGAATTAHTPAVVSGHIYYTNAQVDAVGGYFARSTDGNFMTHIQGYLGDNGTNPPSLQQLQTGFSDGQTLSLCNTSTGHALNVGQVLNPDGTKSVGYHIGSYGSTQENGPNGDPCQNGELDGGLGFFPQLQNVPLSDTIVAQILQYAGKPAPGTVQPCHKGTVEFEAEDITANPGVWYPSGCLSLESRDDNGQFNEASAFTTRDSTNMSAPASNYLDTFAHLLLTDSAGTHGAVQDSNATWDAFPVDADGNGQASDGGSLLLRVLGFANDHFDTYAGSPTG